MKRIIPLFLAVLFLLTACTGSPSAPLALPSASPSPTGTPSGTPEISGEPDSEIEQTPVEAISISELQKFTGTWTGQLNRVGFDNTADLTLDIIIADERQCMLMTCELWNMIQSPTVISEMRNDSLKIGLNNNKENRILLTLNYADENTLNAQWEQYGETTEFTLSRTSDEPNDPFIELTDEVKKKAVDDLFMGVKRNFAVWNDFTLEDWNNAYDETLQRVLATEDDFSFYMELNRFLSLLNEHHTRLEMEPEYIYSGKYATPLKIALFADGYYITGGSDDALALLPLYSKVLSIEGLATQDYLKKNVYPFHWHAKANSAIIGEYAQRLTMLGEPGTKQKFEVLTPDGRQITAAVSREPMYVFWDVYNSGMEIKTDYTQKNVFDSGYMSVEWIDGDILRITIRHFLNPSIVDDFKGLLDVIEQAKGVIFDVRWNGGGNVYYARDIAEHFIHGKYTPPYEQKVTYDETTDSYSLGESSEYQTSGLGVFTTPVAVLQRYTCGSAGEGFLDIMRSAYDSKSFGTESAGATGDRRIIELPNGVTARITISKDFTHDGIPYQNTGIQPDEFIEDQVQDYIDGYDRVLDTAVKYLQDRTK